CARSQVGVFRQVERTELALVPGRRAETRDRFHFEYFKVQRTIPIRHNVKFRESVRERDAVELLGEKVDDRRAEQLEEGGVDAAFEARVLFLERDDEVN